MTVETQQGVVDFLLGAFSFGLYPPYTRTVTCAADDPPVPGAYGARPAHGDTPSIRW